MLWSSPNQENNFVTSILANSHPASYPPFLGTRFYILGPKSVRPQTRAEHGNSIMCLHLQTPWGKERPECFDGAAWPCTDLSFQPVDSTMDSPLAKQEPPLGECPCFWSSQGDRDVPWAPSPLRLSAAMIQVSLYMKMRRPQLSSSSASG